MGGAETVCALGIGGTCQEDENENEVVAEKEFPIARGHSDSLAGFGGRSCEKIVKNA